MILDKAGSFTASSVGTTTLTALVGTDYIDTGVAGGGYDKGGYLVIRMTEAVVGASLVRFSLWSSTTTTYSAGTEEISISIPVASLTLGAQVAILKLPPALKRYLFMVTTVTGATSAGIYLAFMAPDVKVG